MSIKSWFWRSGDEEPPQAKDPKAQEAKPDPKPQPQPKPTTPTPRATPPQQPSADPLSADDFAKILAHDPQPAPRAPAVAPQPVQPPVQAPPPTSHSDEILEDGELLVVAPDNDELQQLQQLEMFVNKLDPSLPQAQRVQTAHAFMHALGKDVAHVIGAAEQKIARIRGNTTGRDRELRDALAAEQMTIQQLESQIEQRRQRAAQLTQQLETVTTLGSDDEKRVHALRQFFGL
jgi:hypothetical protein